MSVSVLYGFRHLLIDDSIQHRTDIMINALICDERAVVAARSL